MGITPPVVLALTRTFLWDPQVALMTGDHPKDLEALHLMRRGYRERT